jgi:hypothetical protein
MVKNMKTALLVIATGEKYHQYIKPLLESADKFFVPYQPIIFTDSPEVYDGFNLFLKDQGYPRTTLYRYHTFLGMIDYLQSFSHIYYTDVDMRFVAPVTEEDIWTDGIIATEHPGYVNLNGTPEKNPASTAYCPILRNYFCGGFNGGTTEAFLNMSETIAAAVDQDTRNGIKAVWNDESHLNRYLYDNPPARVLSPSFCYPESEYRRPGGYYSAIWRAAGRQNIEPKLIALDKVK